LSPATLQPFQVRYGIRVARTQIEDLKKALKLTLVEKYNDPISAEVAAGRLARESIPSWIAWPRTFTYVWLQPVPSDDKGRLGSRILLVPESFVAAAQRVLVKDVSEDALAKLALSYDFNPNDPP